MSSKLFRTSMVITGAVFLFIMGTSVSQAARHTPSVCEGQTGKAFGLCRAAVASGCATASEGTNLRGRRHGHSRRHGHHSRRSNAGSRYCGMLSRNFTRLTNLEPVWIVTENSEPEPSTQTTEPDTTDTTTTDTTTTTTTRTDTRTPTTGS